MKENIIRNCSKNFCIESILLFKEEFSEGNEREDSNVVSDTDGKYQPGSRRESCYVTQLY